MTELEEIQWNEKQREKMLYNIKLNQPDIYEIILLALDNGYKNLLQIDSENKTTFTLNKHQTLSSINISFNK